MIFNETKTHEITVDVVIVTMKNNALQVLLVKRLNEPFKDKWAIPGGYVRLSENLDDAALLKAFNCTAYEKVENEGLRAFLKFIQTDEAESDFTRRLDDMVERKKKIEELKQTYLSWGLHDHDVRREGIREGMEKGIEKGAEEKAVDTVRKFLAMNVLSHEQIAQGVGLPLEKVQEIADQLRIQNA